MRPKGIRWLRDYPGFGLLTWTLLISNATFFSGQIARYNWLRVLAGNNLVLGNLIAAVGVGFLIGSSVLFSLERSLGRINWKYARVFGNTSMGCLGLMMGYFSSIPGITIESASWVSYAYGVVGGCVFSFEFTAERGYIAELITDVRDRKRAALLGDGSKALAQLVGTAIGAVLFDAGLLSPAMYLDGMTYLLVALVLVASPQLKRLEQRAAATVESERAAKAAPTAGEPRRRIRHHAGIISALILTLAVTFVLEGMTALAPGFGREMIAPNAMSSTLQLIPFLIGMSINTLWIGQRDLSFKQLIWMTLSAAALLMLQPLAALALPWIPCRVLVTVLVQFSVPFLIAGPMSVISVALQPRHLPEGVLALQTIASRSVPRVFAAIVINVSQMALGVGAPGAMLVLIGVGLAGQALVFFYSHEALRELIGE